MKMVRIVAGFLLLFAAPAWAGRIEGTCGFRFQGTSTLHDFSGKVGCLPFAAGIVTDETRKTIIPGMDVEVPVDGMDTRNNDRDRQMREMFESDRFPKIHGTVRNIDVDAVRNAAARDGKAAAQSTSAAMLHRSSRTTNTRSALPIGRPSPDAGGSRPAR